MAPLRVQEAQGGSSKLFDHFAGGFLIACADFFLAVDAMISRR